VAVKTADVCPELTVMLAGTVRLELLLERGTESPPDGAAELSETVHEALPGVLIVLGVHVTDAIGGGSDIALEPPVAGILLPLPVEATTLVIWIGMDAVEGAAAIWNVATATVPSEITFEFSPKTMHSVPLQETDLPAAVAALPVTTLTLVMSEEKLNDHCRAAA